MELFKLIGMLFKSRPSDFEKPEMLKALPFLRLQVHDVVRPHDLPCQ